MAVVRGVDQSGKPFQEFCFLKDLSSTGACVGLSEQVIAGAAVELDICTPWSRKRWLRYLGQIIYVGGGGGVQTTGISFISAKPAFIPIEAITQFSGINNPRGIIH